MEASFTINTASKEIRSNETGDKMWLKNCKGDEKIYEKGPQNCWHPLLLRWDLESGSSFFCMKCCTTTLMYHKEDKYYQDVLARFE